ncbi:MAG TPA: response regulator transcription factor [Mycobacteriales bacterium]|jgi:DNA-binding NarL/FixJ family response regulator|nr:response regulator transcription factor [Mycobacteriales bacterium]
MSISVVLVDDQPLLLTGFRMVLHSTPDIVVVGEASDGGQAVDMVARHSPDVVLMDVRMPGVDGIEATRRIVSSGSSSRVVILTTFDLDEYAFAGLRAGASGFLLKNVPPAELIAAIRSVAAGDAVVSPRITRQLLDRYSATLPVDGPVATGGTHPILARLTDREGEVMLAMARGLSNAEIAGELFLSEATVKTHVTRILGKLELRDRVQAVVLAYEQRLIDRQGAG